MTMVLTKVSVVIPSRNEAPDIERCLDHVLAQNYPRDQLEVIVVDGGSTDGTPQLVRRRLEDSGLDWKLIDNPVATTPSNLNTGLRAASGTVICRVDARSFIPPDYVRICVRLLHDRADVAVVGGAQVAIPGGAGVVPRGIARALNNRLVMGGARYRSGAESGPDDTVYLGAFRTAELRSVGGWDERLGTNQDFELNQRMAQRGLVWFDASIQVEYRPRSSFSQLFAQYRRFGDAKGRSWRRGSTPVRRQTRLLLVSAVSALTGVAFVCTGVRPMRRLIRLGIGAAVGVVVVDHVGASGPAPVPERASSASSIVCIATGWLLGVTGGLVHRRDRA